MCTLDKINTHTMFKCWKSPADSFILNGKSKSFKSNFVQKLYTWNVLNCKRLCEISCVCCYVMCLYHCDIKYMNWTLTMVFKLIYWFISSSSSASSFVHITIVQKYFADVLTINAKNDIWDWSLSLYFVCMSVLSELKC